MKQQIQRKYSVPTRRQALARPKTEKTGFIVGCWGFLGFFKEQRQLSSMTERGIKTPLMNWQAASRTISFTEQTGTRSPRLHFHVTKGLVTIPSFPPSTWF